MAEPIKIGGQTFIKNEKGWIDQKTKAKAPEGLITLLDKISEEQSPAGMKKRAILDNDFIVKLGDSEYIWDMNNQIFVDKKTKNPVPKHLSSIIEAAAGMKKTSIEDKSKAASAVVNNMGSTGQAAKQKVKKPTGGGQFSVANVKINSPIIQMIEKLSVIDGYLKQRLANDNAALNNKIVSAKEQAIEQSGIQSNATPNSEEQKIDAQVEKTNKESQAILVAGAAAAGALFISQLDPVKETFNAVMGFARGVYDFASGIVGVINEGLVRIVGTPESRGEQSADATPAPGTSSSSRMSQTSSAGGAEDTTAYAGPGQTQAAGGQAPSGAASPEEITTAFPGPTSSSNTGGAATTPDASSVAAAAGAPPAAPAPSATAVPTRLERAGAGAARGLAVGGVLGAAVGAVTGFFSSPSEDTSTESSAAPAAGATRTSAPSAGATSNQSLSRAAQLAAGQVGITKDGIGGYLRQGGVALDPRFEAWCAAFVNSTLAQAGLKGATNVANSFQKWGDQVEISAVQEGDIVIQTRNKGPDQVGGHIGIATGVRQGNKVEVIAGNTSGKVKKYFLEDNTRNGLQVRRYNPEKPYGAGAVGGAPLGGENPLAAAGAAIADLSVGAMEAIGTILRAGLGSDTMRPTSGSQLSTVNDTMSGNIARAARERTSEVAAARTVENATTSSSASMNLNVPSSSVAIGGGPTASDRAGVEFYLTRMGFPPIHYTQTSWNATIR
jgi:uncharacterized protein (TIGR02594 family)